MTDTGLPDGRTCTSCKEWKPAEEFNVRADNPSALGPWCKTCRNTYDRARRAGGPMVHQWVPAAPVREYVEAQIREGSNPGRIAHAAGVERSVVRHLLGLYPGRSPATRIRLDNADRLLNGFTGGDRV